MRHPENMHALDRTLVYMYKSDHKTERLMHWLYLPCVWYVFDTCWKREVLVV